MGMYMDVLGQEYKLTGLIHEAIHHVHFDGEGTGQYLPCVGSLDVADATAVVCYIVDKINSGINIVTSNDLARLASASSFASAVLHWTAIPGTGQSLSWG